MEVIRTDVLVIGGGGAAARAAIEAHDAGAYVLMAVKRRFGHSGATAYRVAEHAGLAVADGFRDPDDNPDVFASDIIKAAQGCCDPKVARALAYGSIEALAQLKQWGLQFVLDKDGQDLVALGDFASRPRNRKMKGHAHPLLMVLKREVERRNIRVLEKFMVVDLLVRDNECRGAIGVDWEGNWAYIDAGAVIVASGGAVQLFELNLYPPDITGDGYGMCYRAGAELMNMEFMQAGLGFVRPTNMIMGWLWMLRPRVYTEDGQEVLSRYLPPDVTLEQCYLDKSKHFPFSTSDRGKYLEIAVRRETSLGQRVFVDFRDSDEAYLKDFPGVRRMWEVTSEWLAEKGIPIRTEPVEIACFGHSTNGGVRINEDAETTVKGLYAAGECAGGPHGADRLGGTMLINGQVFGTKAGRGAAHWALSQRGRDGFDAEAKDLIRVRKAFVPRSGAGDVRAQEIRTRIQRAATSSLLVERTAAGLLRCLEEINEIRDELLPRMTVQDSRDVVRWFELENLLVSAELMSRAALHRAESRGAHYRRDYPERGDDVQWAHPFVIRKVEDRMEHYPLVGLKEGVSGLDRAS